MTALNVLVGWDEAHLFADTGHYDPITGRLDHLADKVFVLPVQGALLAWSGPSALGPVVANLLRKERGSLANLLRVAPALLAGMGILQRFSAILVGPGSGVAIEEGGRAHVLAPGSVVRSISVEPQLDPDDLRGSAVKVMTAQREASGLVFGECQYWRVAGERIEKQVLHDWGDRPRSILAASTLAAKIQDLTVDKINVTPNAVTKLATGTTTVTSSGDGSYPNVIYSALNYRYQGNGSSASGFVQGFVRRGGSSGDVVGVNTKNFSGLNVVTGTLKVFAVDIGAPANQQYTITYIAQGSGGGGGGGGDVTVSSIATNLFCTVK